MTITGFIIRAGSRFARPHLLMHANPNNHYQFWRHFFVVVGTEASRQTLSVCPSAVGQIHSKELVSKLSELAPPQQKL